MRYKKHIVDFFSFILMILLLVISSILWNKGYTYETHDIVNGISIFSIFMLAFHLFVFKKKNISFQDFRFWYIVLTYVFMFGRIYANALGYDVIFFNYNYTYSNPVILQTGVYIICATHAIFMGMVSAKTLSISDIDDYGFSDRNTFNIGVVCLIISVPFRLYIDIVSMIAVQASGSYSTLFTISTGHAYNFALLFVPSLAYIISSKVLSKRRVKIVVYITLIYFVLCMVLTGDRRYQVIACIVLILVYINSYKIEVIKIRNLIWIIFGILFLSILYQLRKMREGDLNGVSNFFRVLISNLGSYNVVLETLTEFGISFYSVAGILKNIPSSIPFQKGIGFLGALLSILPIGTRYKEFFSSISISNRINLIEGKPVGATLLGDCYANFGWLTIPFIMLFGLLLMKIIAPKNKRNVHYFRGHYYSLFYIALNLVRSSFYEIVRPIFYIYIIPLVVLYFIKKKDKLMPW